MSNSVGVVSLGCDKNRVDAERMLSYLKQYGYDITPEPADADVIVVNTCGFIDSAKQESIDTILEMAEYKSDKCKLLVVTGCLSQRYSDSLAEGLPEVDIIAGTDCYHLLPAAIDERLKRGSGRVVLTNDKDSRHKPDGRVLTTPCHYAYLKIAEGCDNKCTYCAIPSIRGKYTSRSIDELVDEAEAIVRDNGVRELIIVAQDITRYGTDLYGRVALIDLLDRLSALDVDWIRLLYLYPEQLTDELIEYISRNDKICKYVDVPLQHIDDAVLRRMGRRVSSAQIRELISKLHSAGITVRSTFIVGFPGESEEQFNALIDFLAEAKLDACGFFAFSCEEGTAAARLDSQLPEEVKSDRLKRAYAAQEAISSDIKRELIGKTFDVIYEGIDYDAQAFVGRTRLQTPDVDGVTYFTADKPVDVGNIYKVVITDTLGDDLIGEAL
ncbi:MAG: 30S ribosomal protein S12 methylthiotransferase RimO [Clostridia bacterium]|nr:30S ribosomal protein S12 methylthiotransferase RimO [Clostridia bacterium]